MIPDVLRGGRDISELGEFALQRRDSLLQLGDESHPHSKLGEFGLLSVTHRCPIGVRGRDFVARVVLDACACARPQPVRLELTGPQSTLEFHDPKGPLLGRLGLGCQLAKFAPLLGRFRLQSVGPFCSSFEIDLTGPQVDELGFSGAEVGDSGLEGLEPHRSTPELFGPLVGLDQAVAHVRSLGMRFGNALTKRRDFGLLGDDLIALVRDLRGACCLSVAGLRQKVGLALSHASEDVLGTLARVALALLGRRQTSG